MVGGGFRKRVHSVMEPLVAGLYTLSGPKHLNSPEALEFKNILTPSGVAAFTEITDEQQFQILVKSLLAKLKVPQDQDKIFISSQVEKRQGSTQILLHWLETALNSKFSG